MVLVGEPGMGGAASDIGCTLLQVTNPNQANNTLEHATNTWNPGSIIAGMIPGSYGYGAYTPDTNLNTGVRNFGEFWWVRFAIRTKDANGVALTTLGIPGVTHDVPVLTMERLDGSPNAPVGPQVLAEGIEDLQVAYACDLNADGVLTEGPDTSADEWMLNNAADVIATNNAAKCNQPSAVRLTLVARSLTEDNGIDATLTENGRPAAENHSGHTLDNNFTTGRDQFRRRVLTTTVYPRNN